MGDQGVGNLVLHIAGRDADHAFLRGMLAQLLDVLLGEARQRLAVVELQLLQPREAGMLRLFQPRQHGPHRRHFDRVRRDVLAADRVLVVILLVNLHFVRERRDVRHVDLHRPVAKRFHELVVLQPAIFGLVRVADDHFVDIGLRELLRLDAMLLARAEQVVQERHVELEHFDELDDAAIGDVEFAVEIERPRIAVAAVFGDLAVVDVAGELGGVLVLFVLRLERADADAVLLAQEHALHAHVLHHAAPIAVVLLEPLVVHEPAERIELALDVHAAIVLAAALVELRLDIRPEPLRKQVQRLLVHRAPMNGFGVLRIVLVDPAERVECAVIRGRVALDALLEQPGNRALAAADGPVQQQHAALDAVTGGRTLQRIHEMMQRPYRARRPRRGRRCPDRRRSGSGRASRDRSRSFHAVRQDHVVEPLISGSRHLGVLANDVEILSERSHPILAAELFAVLTLGNQGDDVPTVAHLISP